MTTNRLARETSPYLLQHADNPVDWHPWGEEALERARREDRPILLSIGYSACHWCHVMAHESFENPSTARVMNKHFINIKVDREERPDLDRLYQAAHQMLTGRGGGWPLTMFLTPDQVPFFGGTYFPPMPAHGLPAFTDLLERVAGFHREHPDRIREQNAAVVENLARTVAHGDQTGRLDEVPITAAREQLAGAFDRRHGGFGDAPKFPHPTNLRFLLRRAAGGDREAGEMARASLLGMARGGLHDHLGGGFFRYSVDARWEIPHFEKMLYDNGPLIALYAEAARLFDDAELRAAAEGIGEWAMREMQFGEGGYFATLDADTDGHEGGFYLWTPDAVRAVIDEAHFLPFELYFGLDRAPNFEGEWHLRVARPLPEVAEMLGQDAAQVERMIAEAGSTLFQAREGRTRPHRDEKIVTAWNALMIGGMARAGRLLERDDFIASAERALEFLRNNLLSGETLFASCKDGRIGQPGFLDDYAFLLDALLELLQARWRDSDLSLATRLADALLDRFEDESGGGFFFTPNEHERLVARLKPLADESTPAGNGVAASVLLRLGQLIAEPHYSAAAERTLRTAWSALNSYPHAHASLLFALEETLTPPAFLVVRGEGPALTRWRAALENRNGTRQLAFFIPADADLPPFLAEKRAEAEGIAYLCRDRICEAPVRSPEALTVPIGPIAGG